MEYDFLALGSGIAGLTFALNAAPHGSVAILTKKQRSESNTNYAQGGIAAALGADDSWELHLHDTLTAGAGLCARDAVEVLVREGPRLVHWLIEQGAQFDRNPDGSLALGKEAGTRATASSTPPTIQATKSNAPCSSPHARPRTLPS
jgi:L-aspartate oxidase